MKKWFTMMALALCALTLTACGGGAPAKSSGSSAPAPKSEPRPEPEPAPVEPISAVIKSDIGTYGGLGQLSSSGKKKSKSKYDRPITAPDAYNGLYYSGSDE